MFKLPDLPYPSDALSPVLSDVQMRTHHDKHHAKYVETLNTLLKDAGSSPDSLESVVKDAAAGGAEKKKLFNNAAQAWNHGFFWECMTPKDGKPSGELTSAIDAAFGGLDGLKTKFVDGGANQFGSGWVWLVAKGGGLEVVATHDAANPLAEGAGTPILVCDVWEHAYYLDHKQDRKGFLEQWFDRIANWEFASAQHAAAKGSGEGYRYPRPS